MTLLGGHKSKIAKDTYVGSLKLNISTLRCPRDVSKYLDKVNILRRPLNVAIKMMIVFEIELLFSNVYVLNCFFFVG